MMDSPGCTSPEKRYYNSNSVEKVLEYFNVTAERGLSSQEAAQRLEKFGLNELPKVKRSIWKLYFAPFLENALIIVYLIAAILMLILGQILNIHDFSSFTIYFVLANAVVAIFQQVRAQITLNALKKLTRETCTVIREGHKNVIKVELLVPGDILDLQEGNKIPADARLISVNDFYTNESSLSGESVPVLKDPGQLDVQEKDIQKMKNYVFMGTYVTKGNARAIVVATGSNTEIGTISQSLSEISGRHDIPLNRKINNFAKYLGLLVATMFLINLIFKVSSQLASDSLTPAVFWKDLYDSLNIGLKFMPINIVLLVTVILFTGVLKLGRFGVIVRNLTAIESLGRVSVVCTDKTGTLTQNEMTVTHVYADGMIFEVSGVGYSKEGVIKSEGREIGKNSLDRSDSLATLALCGLINNNAEITEETHKIIRGWQRTQAVRKVIGDPMEGALIVLAEKLGVSVPTQSTLLKEFPFDSVLKRMTKIWSQNINLGVKKIVAFSKGATEIILSLSSNIMLNGKIEALNEKNRAEILKTISQWSEKGYRTLGLAYKELDSNIGDVTQERARVEKDLTFLGFVILFDPIRPGAKEAVKTCKTAGVKVVMITGDHPKTAETIGAELGIFEKGDIVVEGKDLSNLDDQLFFKTTIFARVSPGDKQLIIKRYQDVDKVVAMTGDGVNDALALGMADAGLAMGLTGTDVAKEASDMIISDDSFNTIVTGIHEGRGLFAKIRVIIYFFVYVNLTEATIIFLTGFINPNFILIDPDMQIYIFIGLTHGLIPFGFTFDLTGPFVMSEKPRNEEEIFNKNTLRLMLVNIAYLAFGILMGAALVIPTFYEVLANNPGLGAGELKTLLNVALARPRTITLSILMMIEIITAYSIRRPNMPLWKSFKRKDMGKFFVFMTEVAIGGIFWCVYFPFMQNLFLLAPLTVVDWLFVIAVSLPSLVVLELVKWHNRVKKKEVF